MKNYSLLITFFLLLTSTALAQDVAKLEWARTTRGGPNDYNRAAVVSAEKDPSGNTVIFGHFDYTADFDPGPGVFELTAIGDDAGFILKLDPDGNFLWAGTIGKTNNFDVNAMAVDKDGNILLTGTFGGTMDFDPGPAVTNVTSEYAGSSIYVLKVSPAGAFVWLKQGSATSGHDIDTDATGNIFIIGSNNSSSADVDPGPGNIFLTVTGLFVWKITAAGNYGWARAFSGASRLRVDASDNVLLAGSFSTSITIATTSTPITYTSAGNSDIVVGKLLGSDGTYVWSGQMGGTSGDEVWAITSDASNNFYLTGHFNGTSDFDPGAGVSNLTGAAGVLSTYMCKINATGGSVFAKAVGGTGDTWPFSIATDNTDLYVGGRFKGTTDFDPGAGVFNQTSHGTSGIDTYILRLDGANGDFKWEASMGLGIGAGSESAANGLIPAGPGKVIAIGAYRNKMDTDPGPCVSVLTSDDGGYDVFAVKFGTGAPLPVPTLTSFTPTSGPVGTPVTITGTNFGPTPADNVVQFNITNAVVTSNTTTSIDTSVPGGATSGKVKVTAYCTLLTSVGDFTVTGNPTITNFTPTSGPVGTVVTINGTSFSTTPGNNIVTFNGTPAVVTASTATKITTSVPVGATNGKIAVTVGASATATSGANFIVTAPPVPTITTFTPANGPEETLVTINGTNFSPTPSINDVKFNGVTATVVSSTTIRITATVPVGATTGKITVTIGTNTATSATDFTVTAPLATITITTQPQDASECEGITASFTTAATGTTNIQYQWQFALDDGDPGFENIANGNGVSGATTATMSVVAAEERHGLYRCFITGDNASSKRTEVVNFDVDNCGGPDGEPPVIETQQLVTVIGGIVTLDLVPLITTANDNLDINSLGVVTPPASGALASIAEGILTVDYTGIVFNGVEEIIISACDLDGSCAEQTFSIEVAGDIIVYNGISPGGANPSFVIQNIDLFVETQANKVTIFDRWQNQVWTGSDYNNNSVVFKGISDDGKELPAGTYFYKVEFVSGRNDMTGFISLKR